MTAQKKRSVFALPVSEAGWHLIWQLTVVTALLSCVLTLLWNLLGVLPALTQLPFSAKLQALVLRPVVIMALGALVGGVIGFFLAAMEMFTTTPQAKHEEPEEFKGAQFDATVTDTGVEIPAPASRARIE